MAWIVRGDEVLMAAEIAASRAQRRRGLRGRESVEGAFVLRPCRQIHTFGMRFAIDVVFCDADGVVVAMSHCQPRRVSRLVPGASFVIEAATGTVSRHNIAVGDRLEVCG